MNVYISGRVTGLPTDEVKKKFKEAEIAISKLGHKPINPTKKCSEDMDWNTAMKVAIGAMMKADSILLLYDWHLSRGARAELDIANLLQMKAYFNLKELKDDTSL